MARQGVDRLSMQAAQVGLRVLNMLTAGPVSRAADYAANFLNPNALIGAADVIALYNAGWFRDTGIRTLMQYHGADITRPGWATLIRSGLPWPDIDGAYSWLYRGVVAAADVDNLFRFAGLGDPEMRALYDQAPFDFGIEDVRKLHALGELDAEQLDLWLKASGIRRADDLAMAKKLYNPATPDVATELLNRGFIDENKFADQLSLFGVLDEDLQEAMYKLRHHIPSPSVIEEFAVKEVWNKDVVERFGYDDEFDQIPEFNFWMNKLGYGGSPEVPDGGDNQPKTWAQAFWRAHWRTISNEQAYAMLHRCRGDKDDPLTWRIPGVKPFTLDDVNRVLKVNDYPPAFRSQLAAISYLPLRLVDIRRTVFLATTSETFKRRIVGQSKTIAEWAVQEFMDRGQTQAQSEILAEMATEGARRQALADERRRHAAAAKERVKLLTDQYRVGLINGDTFVAEFFAVHGVPLLLVAGDADVELTRRRQEHARVEAQHIMRLVDDGLVVSEVRSSIARIKKMAFKGEIRLEDAVQLLTKGAGLVLARATGLVSRWKQELDEEKVIDATRRIQEMVKDFLLPVQQGIDRLRNLGWSAPQALLEIQEVERDMPPNAR